MYLEWIHPFGDGNGRTGRLPEFCILMRDGLKEVFETIQSSLFRISWENYIHDRVGELRTEGRNDGTIRRLRILALAIPADRVVPFRDLVELNPKVAKEYAGKSKPTLSRDAASLVELGLVVKTETGFNANAEVLKGHVPVSTVRIS